MNDDDEVCLCFHVTRRKIINYCRRERPPVASLISECLSAGTGCGWCVPYLRRIHAAVTSGEADPLSDVEPNEYRSRRAEFRRHTNVPKETEDPQ